MYNFITSIDIDECMSDTDNICDEVDHSQCINTEGSYICGCEMGYTGNGSINCTSIIILCCFYILFVLFCM